MTGCSLSPELFKVYMHKVIQEWKSETSLGIRMYFMHLFVAYLMVLPDMVDSCKYTE
jgi:hypothetical protein